MHKTMIIVMALGTGFAFAGETPIPVPVPPAPGMTPAPTNGVATNAVVTHVQAVAASPVVAPDPRVGKVLLGLAAYLQSAKSFKCTVYLQVNTEMEGMKQEISTVYDLAAEKPNKLALRHVRGMAGNTVVCDGKKLYIYAQSLNRYEERDAPNLVEQLAEGVGPMAGNMLFVDNLLVNDIYAAIMDGVALAVYVGQERVDGFECDRIRFVQEQFDWEIWVSTGSKPVVVQVVNDMAKSFSGMVGEAADPKGMKMTVLNRFSGWAVDEALAAGAFEFVVPPGARKAKSLFEGDEENAGEMPPPPVIKEESGARPLENI